VQNGTNLSPNKISLITPIYNRAHAFQRTWNSVLPFINDIEYVIVSDGSNDFQTLKEYLEPYLDIPNLKLLHYEENGGVGKALNCGISNASGDWITFLGSDDELLPKWLNSINQILESKTKTLDFFYFKLLYANGKSTPTFDVLLDEFSFSNYLKYYNLILEKRLNDESVSLDMGIVVSSILAKQIKFSEGWTYENGWHLQLNKTGKGFFAFEELKFIHEDLQDRLSTKSFIVNSSLDIIKNIKQRNEFNRVLNVFGNDLWTYSKLYYLDLRRKSLRRSWNLIISFPLWTEKSKFQPYFSTLCLALSNSADFLIKTLKYRIFKLINRIRILS